MALFKWNNRGLVGAPFFELERMRNHMENIYNTLAGGVENIRKNYTGVFPLVNLTEDDQNLYLAAELPGVAPEDLNISVKGDTLTLRGEVKGAETPADASYHRREREVGAFSRSVALPVKINADGIEAAFKNGVLTVTMPKSAEAKSRQISIKTE